MKHTTVLHVYSHKYAYVRLLGMPFFVHHK